MVDYTTEYASIVQQAIDAYNGLIMLYQQDKDSSTYFIGCLAQAETKRDGLQQRLANPIYLADTFKDNYYQSIDHFLESHRGEYGPDMPGSNPAKEQLAAQYLTQLSHVVDEIIKVKNAQKMQS